MALTQKPTKTGVVTCKYGTKGGAWAAGYHTGTDYAAKAGEPIYAIAGGEVIFANRMGGWGLAYGIHVIVATQGAIDKELRVAYCHLSYVNLAVIGKGKVKAGDIIGYAGATGNANGVHLHLEARTSPFGYADKTIDPESLYKPAPRKKP